MDNSIERKVGNIIFFRNRKKRGAIDGIYVFEGVYDGVPVAIKRIECDLLGERIEILRKDFFAHENVACYYAKEESDDFKYLVMELCTGNLEELVKSDLQGITIAEALYQITAGLCELHMRGYVHGNLKPRNVLVAKLADGRTVMKLADFQYRSSVVSSQPNDCWRAPETHGRSELDKASDIFSLGCVFCYALTKGSHPFGEETVIACNMKIGKIDSQTLYKIDDEAMRELVKLMIDREPSRRPSIETVINNPAMAFEISMAQFRGMSISHPATPRIPRTGTSIGNSASVGVEVYETWVGNQIRAIKKINVTRYATNYRRELELLTRYEMSNCPYLVRYYSHDEDRIFCYIEMERCNASLEHYIESKKFTSKVNDRQTRRLFQKNIVEGVEFLHSDRINLIHRDIKPSNVLIWDDGRRLIPKISDYGISEPALNDGFQETILHRGTDGWRAPEIHSLRKYSKAVDCFALGCLMFYIETEGGHPFNNQQSVTNIDGETQRNIDKYNPSLESISRIEPTLQDFICKAIDKDFEARISSHEMLFHPSFFTNEKALEFLRNEDERKNKKERAEMDEQFKRLGLVNIVIGADWKKRLQMVVQEEAAIGPNKQKKKELAKSEYGTSISNLLHLIRNKHAHYSEMDENARKIIGKPPDKYFDYWFEKFPHLLVTIWNVTKNQKLPKLTNEIHEKIKAEMGSSQQAAGFFPFENIAKRWSLGVNKQMNATAAARKNTKEVLYSRTRPQLTEQKSYFDFLTDFRFELIGRLGASHNLEKTKEEIVYRLRHRIDIGVVDMDVDDSSAPINDIRKRSTYEALLELINDYEPPAICEIFQLLLESRFTAPLFTPITNESYLALFDDIHLNGVPNEPPITIGSDTRLSRVVLASCRSPELSQSLELLKELFHLDTLHRNDLFDRSPANQPLTMDVGLGWMRIKGEQQHVVVVHIVGEFGKVVEFIKNFADVLLVEDTPSGEKTTSFSKLCNSKDVWSNKNMLTLVWKPSFANHFETSPYQCLEMQYGNLMIGKLASKIMDHFNNNRRFERNALNSLILLKGQVAEIEYPLSKTKNELEQLLHYNGMGLTRNELVLQRNFREQAKYEEKRREHRLLEEESKIYEQKISECIEWRIERSPTVSEIKLLQYFVDMIRDRDQNERVTRARRLEQYLSRLSETQVQRLQIEIDQYHALLMRCDPRSQDDEGTKQLKEKYLQKKNDYRESILRVEHLWRELSHLFVADKLKYADAPRLAAQHLLGGFSVELLDGDANLLNLPWIQSVLDNLDRLMEPYKNRVFVLSVLGIQSSGKSTLLNTMFGIKLRTSVGQCTRGIYMQLVPVRGRQEYDYILILDTEGMRSPDYHGVEGNDRRDNQMATLSILLADATVVVNPGENDAAIREVLPVVLMAYKRSKLAEESRVRLSSMMFFVYNRIDTMQREKVSNIVQALNDSLVEAFKIVADANVGSETCLFGNFRLDASNSSDSDVRILGNNKLSFTPPDNVQDPAYGETLAEFREHIHRRVVEERREWKSHSPQELSTYIGKVWNCLGSADFSM